MAESKNLDDLIIKVANEQLHGTAEPTPPIERQPEPSSPQQAEANDVTDQTVQPSEAQENSDQNVPHGTLEPKSDQVKSEQASSDPIDEYGNPVAKPKMYTDEDVQRMIRERLRNRGAENQPQPQNQQPSSADGFKHDPNSEETWEQQLESFVERTIDKRQEKQNKKQWQEQELQRQNDFEEKFSAGMSKYDDFHQVVAGKPVTNTMMLATRSLENPAAFIYSAAKMHPQELNRIAQIGDPYLQAAEVGRLHERMVKSKNIASGAPRPIETPRGDMPPKTINQPSLEDRIHSYAKQKRK